MRYTLTIVNYIAAMKNITSALIVVFAIFFQNHGFAQWNENQLCGTAEPSPAHFAYIEKLNEQYDLGIERVSNDRINIPVKFHIVTDFTGARYDYNTLLTVLCELNEKFEPAGMSFYMRGGVNVINNSNYFRHTSYNTGSQLMLEHNQVRVVNIYFVDLGPIGLCGYAYFPGSGPGSTLSQGGVMMSIPCSQVGNTTLAHELGHFFALPHPFDGTSNNPKDVFAERVTRNPNETLPRLNANCASQGDRFCDTPADYIGFRWNCNGFTVSDSDINGDLFQPDPTLYMSYSSDFCMNRFSPQQINTMRQTLIGGTPSDPAPRGYLTVFPMPAWDTIDGPVNLIEPVAGSAPQPANWVFFRWNKAEGATQYFVRIRRNNLPVTEFITTDTVQLFTMPGLQANLTYTYTVRPFNHAYTCVGPSQAGTFTTSAAYGASVFEDAQSQIKVYPTLLHPGEALHVRNEGRKARQLKLHDLQGRLVWEQMLDEHSDMHQIEMPALPAALYHIQFETNQGPVFHRLVIQ